MKNENEEKMVSFGCYLLVCCMLMTKDPYGSNCEVIKAHKWQALE